MSLVINHNLMAINASRNLNSHYNELSVSTQRLSSGLRINTAADDAAGLAVRELMRADVSTLNQGIRNANDAVSLIQTADGALQIIDEKLIRMKELAEQAATGTYTSTQRMIIDSEYQAMASEITRIAMATDFNGIYLLNGNLSSSMHLGSGLNSRGKLKVHFGSGNLSSEDYYYVQIGCSTASAFGIGNNSQLLYTDSELAAAGWLHSRTAYVAVDQDNNVYDIDKKVNTWDFMKQLGPGHYTLNIDYNAKNNDKLYVVEGIGDTNIRQRAFIGTDDGKFTDISASNGASISTQELAQCALDALNTAIVSKDIIRANLGALQNRLENTISNLEVQTENLMASESQISDVDVATEMTEFVREQILTQAAVAMLSQANSLPKMALQLIQG